MIAGGGMWDARKGMPTVYVPISECLVGSVGGDVVEGGLVSHASLLLHLDFDLVGQGAVFELESRHCKKKKYYHH